MSLTFKTLDKKDYKKAIDFAIRGMHCNVYFDSHLLCGMYGRYLLYTGLVHATQIIAAYDGERYLGLLLARMDGEISYLAIDPDLEGQGIGTALLHEYESRERGKEVYLYTDNQCTWQFYEHSGFTRSGEKDIVMDGLNGFPLKCMLYNKKIS